MSNLRSDCWELLEQQPLSDLWRAHVNALCNQIDHLEELWHSAERQQRCQKCNRLWTEHCEACIEGGEPPKTADLPLVCRIEREQLVIRIGIDTLAFATEHCERFYDHEQHDGPPYCSVIDNAELAHDVQRALLDEREDGATPLSLLIDECTEAARDDGSLAFAAAGKDAAE